MLRKYEPSGKCSPLLLLVLPVVVLATIGAGALYDTLMDWIPFLVLDALIIFGYAAVVAGAIVIGLRAAKCRNVSIGIASGLFVGIVAIVTIHAFAYWEIASKVNIGFLEYIQKRAAIGWTVGHGVSGGGLPITGVFAYLIWLVEAGVLLFASFGGGLIGARSPFCETCGVSATRKDRSFLVPGLGDASVGRLVGAAGLEQLLTPPLAEVRATESGVEYKVRRCPRCQDLGFLTVTRKIVTVDSKNKKQTRTKMLHEDVTLDAEEMAAVLRLEQDVADARAVVTQGFQPAASVAAGAGS